MLESNFMKEKAAKMQIPAVWGIDTSYSQNFFQVGWRKGSTMVKLYQAHHKAGKYGFRYAFRRYYSMADSIELAVTAIPAHLASGMIYLLVGRSGDDLMRMLLLPKKGPPEIKELRVTLNQTLDELHSMPLPATIDRGNSEVVSDGVSLSTDEDNSETDEDNSETDEEESSDTRSEMAAMSADDDSTWGSDSEESSGTRLEVAAMATDGDRAEVSDSD